MFYESGSIRRLLSFRSGSALRTALSLSAPAYAHPGAHSSRLAEREIETVSARQWMSAIFERVHSVIVEPRRPTPNKNVATRYRHTNRLFGSLQSAKKEDCRKPHLELRRGCSRCELTISDSDANRIEQRRDDLRRISLPQCSLFADVVTVAKFELRHCDWAVLEISFRISIGSEAVAQEGQRMADYILVLAGKRISESNNEGISLLRNVFQAIDEVVRIFALLTVIVGYGLEAGEAYDVRVPNGLSRLTVSADQLRCDFGGVIEIKNDGRMGNVQCRDLPLVGRGCARPPRKSG